MMTIGWNQDKLREIARQKAYRKKRMEIIKQKNEFREKQKIFREFSLWSFSGDDRRKVEAVFAYGDL